MNETKTEALAVTRSEQSIDKSGWARGPWDDEPDLIEWTSPVPPHFWCQVARSETTGVLCGYVAVPADHPLHGKALGEGDDRVDVHGGLSFAGPGVAGLWVLGFDCGHAYDVQPGLDAQVKGITGRSFTDSMNRIDLGAPFRLTYKALPFVRAECESLARQLAAMGPPALTEGTAPAEEQPPKAAAKLSPREVAFFEAIVQHDIGNASSSDFLASAVSGFTMREHVREAHAGREEECAHAAPPDEPQRSWWLFGYNFEEPGAVARQLEAESELEP